MLTPSIFRQLLRAIPGNGAGSAAAAAWCRLRLRFLKMTSVDLLQFSLRLFRSAHCCTLVSSAGRRNS